MQTQIKSEMKTYRAIVTCKDIVHFLYVRARYSDEAMDEALLACNLDYNRVKVVSVECVGNKFFPTTHLESKINDQ